MVKLKMKKTHNEPFSNLRLFTGDQMQAAMKGVHLEDEEQITAVIIQNVDTDSDMYSNCVLIDKDGTANYYVPEEGDTVQRATLYRCLECITDEPESALEHYLERLAAIIANFDIEAAQRLMSDY